MLVYEGVKSTFIEDVNLNLIVNKIYEKYQKYFGRTTKSQLNSWQNSMQYMRSILDDDEIPENAGVAIEFNIPTTSKRIDFILSGRDHNMKDSAVIVELKQWETCAAVENKDGIVSDRKTIYVNEEGFVLSETGRLSGSSKPVLYGVKNLVEKLGIPLEEVVKMSSLNPARKYGFGDTKGSIAIGKDADYAVIDDDYNCLYTYCKGREVFDYLKDTELFNKELYEQIKLDE